MIVKIRISASLLPWLSWQGPTALALTPLPVGSMYVSCNSDRLCGGLGGARDAQAATPPVQRLSPITRIAKATCSRHDAAGLVLAAQEICALARLSGLRVAETVSLGEKRFVALVRVENCEFLIGGGASGVSLLTQLKTVPGAANARARHWETRETRHDSMRPRAKTRNGRSFFLLRYRGPRGRANSVLPAMPQPLRRSAHSPARPRGITKNPVPPASSPADIGGVLQFPGTTGGIGAMVGASFCSLP